MTVSQSPPAGPGRKITAARPTGRGRVMVVDDDRDMLAVLKKVLARKCGCALALAESAEVALELLGTFRPDVVLTDIRMAGLDGLSLLEEIKKTRQRGVGHCDDRLRHRGAGGSGPQGRGL